MAIAALTTLDVARPQTALTWAMIIGGIAVGGAIGAVIARRIRPRTYCVEDASGIRPAMLRGAGTIGVSGGASTPPEVLREVVERIKTRIEHKNPREKRVQ